MEQTRYDLQALKIIHKNLTCDFEVKVAELKSANDVNASLQSELGSCKAELKSTTASVIKRMYELKEYLIREKKAQQVIRLCGPNTIDCEIISLLC